METPAAAAPTSDAAGTAQPFVLVAYWSQTGMTKRLAEAVAEGALAAGARVRILPVDSIGGAVLDSADAVLLGSPTHWANIATPMKAFIDRWPELGFSARDRIGGAFATGGTGGGGMEEVVTSLLLAMLNHGMIVVGPVFREGDIEFGNFGVAAATGSTASPSIAETSLEAARALGRRATEIASLRPRGRGTP
jgi:NAD(P)H dehydrogenase (quinone)